MIRSMESDVTLGDPRATHGAIAWRIQRFLPYNRVRRWLHTRNNHRPAVLVVESPQGVETLAPHLEHLTFTSQIRLLHCTGTYG